MAYPPFPWRLRLRGMTLATLHTVAVETARRRVAPSLRIVRVWPGTTLGGLFLADYGPGSDLVYRELIASCAVVLHEARLCAWITHVYVDNRDSVEGGRHGLGVPKEPARFEPWRGPDGREGTAVIQGDRTVCTLVAGPARRLWRQRVRVRALHRDVERPATLSLHGNEIAGRIGLCPVAAEIPPGSPLRELGFGPPLIGICGSEMDGLLGGAPFLPHRTIPL